MDYAQKVFPRAEVHGYPDWAPDIVEAVSRGELTAGYSDEIEIRKYILRHPEASIRSGTAIIKDLTDPIAMAVPWDSHGLLDWLNIYIQDHAGADIIIFGNNLVYDQDIALKAREIVLDLVQEGHISRDRINESYKRIQQLKSWLQ